MIKVKNGDFYKHYKGGEYFFDCIALPINDRNLFINGMAKTDKARYHEDTHDLELYTIDGVTFINSDIPHVIYQAEKDYDTNFVYAREVDDFFGYKTEGTTLYKRFVLKG